MEHLYAAYPPDPSKDEIRLFTMLSEPWNDSIKGKFSVVSLYSNPEFIALSYVWGDATTTTILIVENEQIPVSQNLHEALRRLRWHACRKKRHSTVIWADALCIYQTDLREKERQIPLMRKVYSQCTFTAIWLGEIPTLDLVEPLQPLVRHHQVSWKRKVQLSTTTMSISERLLHKLWSGQHLAAIEPFDRDNQNPYFIGVQAIFRSLATNAWFKRRWVIQEAVLAPSVKVYFGEISVELFTLIGAMGTLAKHTEQRCCMSSQPGHYLLRQTIRGFLQRFIPIHQLRSTWGREAHVVELCQYFTDRKTSIDADCVYSFLGLTNPPSTIIPDYELPLPNLMEDICVGYTDETHSLSFLPLAGIGNGRKGMPSWVVDWTDCDDGWNSLGNLFDPTPGFSQVPQVQQRPLLQILACGLDEVEEISTFPTNGMTNATTKAFAAYLMTHNIFDTNYPCGRSWREAWLRTLSADCCWGPNTARRLTSEDVSFFSDSMAEHISDNPHGTVRLADGRQVPADAHLNDMMRMVSCVLDDRVFFYTLKGYIGPAKHVVRPGNRVYLVRILVRYPSLHLRSHIMKHHLDITSSPPVWNTKTYLVHKFYLLKSGTNAYLPSQIPGCSLPMLMRDSPRGSALEIVSSCYLHGWMDGFEIPRRFEVVTVI